MTPVIEVNRLSVAFGSMQVTDRVSFRIFPGEFFALVGESGCGKSVSAMGILRLLPYPSSKIVEGEAVFCDGDNEVNLTTLPLKKLQKYRGSKIACIFQEPMQALNPVVRIKKQLLEVFKFCDHADLKVNPEDEIRRLMLLAGFTDVNRVLESFPHELSGGMLQRVCIVMALLPRPKLIIADEPTTALDVTVQAQVLGVLKEMSQSVGTAVLLITHNMGIVSQYAQRVAVMYAGRIVETGTVEAVIENPLHPYTQGLLAAIPESHSQLGTLKSIPGSVPQPKDFAEGCRFADRCEKCANASEIDQCKCRSRELPPRVISPQDKEHLFYCHL